MNSRKPMLRKPLRTTLEFQPESTIGKLEESEFSNSASNEISMVHEPKRSLRKRKASEYDKVEEEKRQDDMCQKERDELSKAIELSRVSSKQEAAQRFKQEIVEDLTTQSIIDDSEKAIELSIVSSKQKAAQRFKQEIVEDLTTQSIIDDSENSSLDDVVTQLSGSQSLFDSSKEDDNDSSNNTQVSQSLIQKIDEELPETSGMHKNLLTLKKHRISQQLLPELPNKIRRISESSDSSCTLSPVFGLNTSAKSPLPEEKLINLRRENLQVFFKCGRFYAPPGADLNGYAAHIIHLFNAYEINLRRFQSQSYNKLDWPKPVVNGPYGPNTLDQKRRYRHVLELNSDNDDDHGTIAPKNENDNCQLHSEMQEDGQAIEALKFDEDTELPDIPGEILPLKMDAASRPGSVPLGETQEADAEKRSAQSLVNKPFQIDIKDDFPECDSQEDDFQTSTSKFLENSHQIVNNDKNSSNRVISQEEDDTMISTPPYNNSTVTKTSNEEIEERKSPNKEPSTAFSQVFNHQAVILEASEPNNSGIWKSLTSKNGRRRTRAIRDEIACPLCNSQFSVTEIEAHAAYCQGSSEPRRSEREIKFTRRRGLPMEHILQQIDTASSDEFDNSSQETTGLRVKNKRSFRPAAISKKLIDMKKSYQIEESLEKCYVCNRFFSEGEPYEMHVKHCISSLSDSREPLSQLKSPRSKNNIQLLNELENSSGNSDDDSLPPLQKRAASSSSSTFPLAVSTSNNGDINLSSLKISGSPLKSFRTISNQEDNIINYSKQFRSLTQRHSKEMENTVARNKTGSRNHSRKKKSKFS